MDEFSKDYLKIGVAAGFTFIISFILKGKFFSLVSWIRQKCFGFQEDIVEIKKATEQIVQDWIVMGKMITQIQNEQNNFASRLQDLCDTKNIFLEQDINTALEEIFRKNDQRYLEMKQTVEILQKDIQSIKIFLQSLVLKSSEQFDGEKNGIDNAGQAGGEIKKEINTNTGKKNRGEIDYDTSKVIASVKECLTDLLKDAKLHLSVDREEENRELEIIFTKLADDREDIKQTIIQAFSIVAEQAKRNYDQFGEVGEEAMKYMAILSDSTNKLLKLKLGETEDVLKNTLNVVRRQTFDIDAVRKILGNIDGQLGELFEKVVQIYEINIDHCGETTLILERMSDNWVQTVLRVEKMAKQICEDTKHVKQIFKEIKDLDNTPQEKAADNGKRKEKIKNAQRDPADNIAIQDQQNRSQNQENRIFVYSCWERMRSVSCNVEDGCNSVNKLICELEQKLGSLNEAIEKLDNFIRGLNLEILAEHATSVNYNDTAIISQTSQCDGGDGHSQVLNNAPDAVKNKSLAHKIQNAIAVENAVKLTEIILKKVCGKNNSQDNENSIQSKADRTFGTVGESGLITDEKSIHRSLKEP